jgi:hypothetical protein
MCANDRRAFDSRLGNRLREHRERRQAPRLEMRLQNLLPAARAGESATYLGSFDVLGNIRQSGPRLSALRAAAVFQQIIGAALNGESACSTEGKIRRYGESGEMVRFVQGSVGPLLTDHQRALTDALATGGGKAKQAFEAMMMTMKKTDIAAIEAARD